MSGNKNLKTCLAMALLIPLMPCLAGAKIIYVDNDGPADFNNIQAATQNGDVNVDKKIDINDVHYLLDYLFNKGPAPIPIKAGLPVTGQTKCYNNETEITCPQPGEPFYGQDGSYQAGIPRNFDVVKPDPNDNSTWYTIDHVTGLMWQYKNDGPLMWQDALAYCENLKLGGFSDWRLPNVNELESIVDYGKSPAIDTNAFFYNPGYYWTSTTFPKYPSDALIVIFDTGSMNPGFKNQHHYFVRAVRTIQPIQNGDVDGDERVNINDVYYLLDYLFNEGSEPVSIKPVARLPVTGQTKCYDNEKEIPCPQPGEPFYGQDGNYQAGIPRNFEVVKPDQNDNSSWYTIDHVTGLMWQYKNDGIARNWQDALAYCENLKLGGFSDWRLPNVSELESIFDYGHFDPTIDSNFFLIEGGGESRKHWTSTTLPPWKYDDYAFIGVFYQGGIWIEAKPDTFCLSRAVRTIKPGDLEREKTLSADLNNDGIVNLKDLAKFADQWLMTELWYNNSQ